MVTMLGQCIRFKETDVRPTGRSAMGVIGMSLMDEDEVVGVQVSTQGDTMLIVSEMVWVREQTLTSIQFSIVVVKVSNVTR